MNVRLAAAATAVGLLAWSVPLRGQAGPTMTVHFVSVGQALATLIEFPCGAMLVDVGADKPHQNELVTYLTSFFARRTDLNNTIDLMVITHQHIDHTRSLKSVVQNFTVKRYVDNGKTNGSGISGPKWVKNEVKEHRRNIAIREVFDSQIASLPHKTGLTDSVIDPFDCGTVDPKVHILSGSFKTNPGWSDTNFRNPNNHSLVVRVDFGNSSALFTGDLEVPGITRLLQQYSGADAQMLNTDLLQVGHHGGSDATTQGLLSAVTPSVAVIPVGFWKFGQNSPSKYTTNAFGHPTQAAIDLLVAGMSAPRTPAVDEMIGEHAHQFHHFTISKAIYATGWDGNVDVVADTTAGLTIHTQ